MLVCSPLAAAAQDTRTQLIVDRCSQILSELSEVQRRDLVARTNMGREYENIDKQLTAFTQRVHNNNFNQQPFADTLTQYHDAVNQFRSAYVSYDDSMTELQNIDCKKQPADFSNKLQQTRTLRQAAQDHVAQINSALSHYHDLMEDLKINVEGGAGQ